MLKTEAKPHTETEKLFALDKHSLENLSYVLRHPDTWPKNFYWGFGHCDTCAMGLAHKLWSEHVAETDITTAATVMAKSFSMPYEDAERIFLKQRGKSSTFFGVIPTAPDMERITPEMVADQIDKYLANAK